jgi:hypothetical protein
MATNKLTQKGRSVINLNTYKILNKK